MPKSDNAGLVAYWNRPRVDLSQLMSDNKAIVGFHMLGLGSEYPAFMHEVVALPWPHPPHIHRTFRFEVVTLSRRLNG